jgi:tetratricopeptide (TPR) repeat protein
MWKVLKYLLTGLAGLLLFTLPLFFLTNWLQAKDFPNLHRLLSFLRDHWAGLTATILVIAVLALYSHQRDRLKTVQDKVFLYKSASALRPADINPASAWYDEYFLPRGAVDKAVDLLSTRRGVLLLGVPLIGKTRCAYEALKKLKGHHILSLAPDNKIEDIKLPRTWSWRKPRLILLLDDIDRFAVRFTPDLLYKQLERQSRSVAVLATVRSGQEHKLIQDDRAFGPFVSLHLTPVPVEGLTKAEEKIVADRFGRAWSEDMYNGTPGAIVLGIDTMRRRLHGASDDVKMLMRSLCLMRKAGIQTYRRSLAQDTASEVFGSTATVTETDSAWLWLKGERFLEIDGQRGVMSPTHAVYLSDSFYPEFQIRDPTADISNLWTLVSESGNADDVFSMAFRWAEQKDYPKAEIGFRKYVEIDPSSSIVHSNLGNLLSDLRRNEEAEREYRDAIRINPDYAAVHSNLGNLLSNLAGC